ncbi:DciA family protein [Streptomyces sp. NPDC006692]|uniref:DciA family protein n=1 Tax=unclassified Streptomyces TaxID=2593676 RepID=UPI003413331D
MTDQAEVEPELSGVDLARVALRAAQEDARRRGTEQSARKQKRRTRPVSRDGRDPIGLGQAIVSLIAERAWETPAAGGSVLDQWPAIAGDLARHVTAVSFDDETGRLDLRPESPAYATHLRFEANRLISAANATVRRADTVRTIRILRPGPVEQTSGRRGPDTADVPPASRAPSGAPAENEPRRQPPTGYLEAVEAARVHKAAPQVSTERVAVTERQARESRARGQVRAQSTEAEAAPTPQDETTEQTRQRALRRRAWEQQEERRRTGAITTAAEESPVRDRDGIGALLG